MNAQERLNTFANDMIHECDLSLADVHGASVNFRYDADLTLVFVSMDGHNYQEYDAPLDHVLIDALLDAAKEAYV